MKENDIPTMVFLIRHGEVINAGEKRYNGHNDIDLSPEGIRHMEVVADRLSKEPISAVYCSDLIRTIKGAEIIAGKHSLPITKKPGLRERNVGVWEGMTFEEIQRRFRKEWEEYLSDVVNFKPDGGESISEVRERAVKEMESIIRDHKGEGVVIVAHGGINRTILCTALGLELKNIFRIEQNFGAVNIIEYYDDIAVVRLMNG